MSLKSINDLISSESRMSEFLEQAKAELDQQLIENKSEYDVKIKNAVVKIKEKNDLFYGDLLNLYTLRLTAYENLLTTIIGKYYAERLILEIKSYTTNESIIELISTDININLKNTLKELSDALAILANENLSLNQRVRDQLLNKIKDLCKKLNELFDDLKSNLGLDNLENDNGKLRGIGQVYKFSGQGYKGTINFFEFDQQYEKKKPLPDDYDLTKLETENENNSIKADIEIELTEDRIVEDGSKENPFSITKESDFEKFAESDFDEYFRLEKDIEIKSGKKFIINANLDGNGRTIKLSNSHTKLVFKSGELSGDLKVIINPSYYTFWMIPILRKVTVEFGYAFSVTSGAHLDIYMDLAKYNKSKPKILFPIQVSNFLKLKVVGTTLENSIDAINFYYNYNGSYSFWNKDSCKLNRININYIDDEVGKDLHLGKRRKNFNNKKITRVTSIDFNSISTPKQNLILKRGTIIKKEKMVIELDTENNIFKMTSEMDGVSSKAYYYKSGTRYKLNISEMTYDYQTEDENSTTITTRPFYREESFYMLHNMDIDDLTGALGVLGKLADLANFGNKVDDCFDPDTWSTDDSGETEGRAMLSGTWVFNKTITVTANQNGPNIKFTSNAKEYYNITAIEGSASVSFGEYSVYANGSWVNDAYRTVNFGATKQEVSKDFYNWFTANAVKLNSRLLMAEYLSKTSVFESALNRYVESLKLSMAENIKTSSGVIQTFQYIEQTRQANDSKYNSELTQNLLEAFSSAYSNIEQFLSFENGLEKRKALNSFMNECLMIRQEINNLSIGLSESIIKYNEIIEGYSFLKEYKEYDVYFSNTIEVAVDTIRNLTSTLSGAFQVVPYANIRQFNGWMVGLKKYTHDGIRSLGQVYIGQELGMNSLPIEDDEPISIMLKYLVNDALVSSYKKGLLLNHSDKVDEIFFYEERLERDYGLYVNLDANYENVNPVLLETIPDLYLFNNLDLTDTLNGMEFSTELIDVTVEGNTVKKISLTKLGNFIEMIFIKHLFKDRAYPSEILTRITELSNIFDNTNKNFRNLLLEFHFKHVVHTIIEKAETLGSNSFITSEDLASLENYNFNDEALKRSYEIVHRYIAVWMFNDYIKNHSDGTILHYLGQDGFMKYIYRNKPYFTIEEQKDTSFNNISEMIKSVYNSTITLLSEV